MVEQTEFRLKARCPGCKQSKLKHIIEDHSEAFPEDKVDLIVIYKSCRANCGYKEMLRDDLNSPVPTLQREYAPALA